MHRLHSVFVPSVIAMMLIIGAVAVPRSASADPNFTLDPASPSLAAIPATAADVLNPATGTPKWGGQPPPGVVLPGAALGLPPAATIDDFSYGDEIPAGPLALAYSVGRTATGFPIGGNALAFEAAAAGPEGAVGADLYTPAGPLLPGPCGLPPVLPNALLSDGDGKTGGAPPPRLGLGLDELPPFTYASQDNVSGLELENYAGGPVYFTVDAATAALLGVSPADILARFPGGPPGFIMWAPAGMLGLVPGDDIDALSVGDVVPADMALTPGVDSVFFSLKAGSPSLGLLPHCGLIPGPASPGDVWWSMGPGLPAPFVDAEMLGLATVRAGFAANDELDALDFVSVAAPMDTDGDGADNAVDFDDDNDACPDPKEPVLVPPTSSTNPWDFYSVPVPALFAVPNPLIVFKDSVLTGGDAQAVFAYAKKGAKTGTLEYEQDLNGNGTKDGVEYDRSVVGPAMSGPPDGVVTGADAQLAFAQVKLGYAC